MSSGDVIYFVSLRAGEWHKVAAMNERHAYRRALLEHATSAELDVEQFQQKDRVTGARRFCAEVSGEGLVLTAGEYAKLLEEALQPKDGAQ